MSSDTSRSLITGPTHTLGGYGTQSRYMARMLADLGHEVTLSPTAWVNSTWLFEDNEEKRWLDSLVGKGDGKFQYEFDVVGPAEVRRKLSPDSKKVLYSAGSEANGSHPEWKIPLASVDLVITPSMHSARGIEHHNIVPIPFSYREKTPVNFLTKEHEEFLKDKFVFYSVSAFTPRKDLKTLVESFYRTFWNNDECVLVLKTNGPSGSLMDYTRIKKEIELTKLKGAKCHIMLIHGYMSKDHIDFMHESDLFNTYITTSHGEGFGLPIFDAACSGKRIVTIGWSGHAEYLNYVSNDQVICLEYTVDRVRPEHLMPNYINPECIWAYVDRDDLAQKMNFCFNNPEYEKQTELIRKQFDYKKNLSLLEKTLETRL